MDTDYDFEMDEDDISADISAAKLNILPKKSSERYHQVYDSFCAWRRTKSNVSKVNMEDMMIAYFYETLLLINNFRD